MLYSTCFDFQHLGNGMIYYQEILTDINEKDLILTVNRRLSQFLLTQFQQLQLNKGLSIWITPRILPFTTWIEETWRDCLERGLVSASQLLQPIEELIIWKKIIANSEIGEHLLQLEDCALHVLDAWQLCQQWLISVNKIDPVNEDVIAFKEWSKQFEQQLVQEELISGASLLLQLCHLISVKKLILPNKIILVGYDSISPIIKHFSSIAKKASCTLLKYQEKKTQQQISCQVYNDASLEIKAMAQFCYEQLKKNPDCEIACIVPDLDKERKQIQREFMQIFQPALLLNTNTHPENLPFNFSAGFSLTQYPVIYSAFQFFHFLKETISLNTISHILRSPFLGGAENELLSRANCDAEIRFLNNEQIELDTLIALAKNKNPERYVLNCYSPILIKLLNRLVDFKIKIPNLQSFSQWLDCFDQLLALLQWPGQRVLNSTEYQIVNRFKEALLQFKILDKHLLSISLNQALTTTHHLMQQITFQAKSKTKPIQILGLLEATGMKFDHTWVSGLDDETWPSSPSANPFLPIELQRKCKMPHSGSDRELEFCLDMTQHFINSSPNVIFSYHKKNDDRELNISPLIKQYEVAPSIELKENKIDDLIYQSSVVEYLNDEKGPPLQIDEKIHGGTSIFKEQAICPFRAFAHIRLGSQGINIPELGLDAAERGSILHRTLEIIWSKLKSQQQLNELSDKELTKLIRASSRQALLPFLQRHASSLKARFQIIEQQRIEKIIKEWLEIEKSRPPFTVIATEDYQTSQFAGISLHFQVDRIDKLNDGKIMIIDYKTGNVSINDWFGERTQEPQLPLYCISHDSEINGICFALLKHGKMQFKGIAEHSPCIDGVKTLSDLNHEDAQFDWSSLLSHWYETLTNIAEEFKQGDAKVDPFDVNTSCQYCDLHAFCRIYEEEA